MDFSFVYDGKAYSSERLTPVKSGGGATEYVLDNVRIVRTETRRGGAVIAVTEFENLSNRPSGIFENICDIDEYYRYPAPSLEYGYSGYGDDRYLYLVKTLGSNYGANEFSPQYEALRDGSHRTFSCRGGRSSQGYAPFFELNLRERGTLFALGWSGQWQADVVKDAGGARVTAGIAGARYYLMPHEKLRGAEIVALEYDCGSTEAHNLFKRVLLGRSPENLKAGLPFFTSFWGGASSGFMLKQLDKMHESGIPFDCFWVDAGWYGDYKTHCASEFTPEWGEQTGNWFVNTAVHPNGLQDVFDRAKGYGLKTLLWLEPERAIAGTKLAKERPEWFLTSAEDPNTLLLDLGCDEARQYFTDLIADFIARFRLDYYRQDFNMDPLPYWEQAEEPDRRCVRQIKHILGLYRMWDDLLARFPHLVIDNCASGGRRIDTETLTRSVPLWRSDYQCVFDADPEAAQNHNMSISRWLPYSATGVGFLVTDPYRFRSCYAAGLNSNFFGYEEKAPERLDPALREYVAEYKSVQKYFSKDYYPLFGFGDGHAAWGGWQFHDPQDGSGIVMAFRRDQSPCDRAVVYPQGLRSDSEYELTSEDGTRTVSGGALQKKGLSITIANRRDSRLIRYRVKQ